MIYRSRVLWVEDENGRKKEMEMTRKMTISELLGFIFWVRGE